MTYRSFERDPFDWAHTQITLGLAYTRLHDGRRRENLHRGVEHYGRALRGFDGHPAYGSQALGTRARARLARAQQGNRDPGLNARSGSRSMRHLLRAARHRVINDQERFHGLYSVG